MKRLLPFALLFSATAFAADTSLAGRWVFSGTVEGVDVHDVCTLTQKDTALTGSCTGNDGKARDTTGTIDGKNLTLKHLGEYQGDDLTLTYTGKLSDDGTVSGTIDVQPQNVSGSFTATKTPAPSAQPNSPQ